MPYVEGGMSPHRRLSPVTLILAAWACVVLTGCHSPNKPSDPQPDPLALACSSGIRVENAGPTGQNVTYSLPAPSGGVEPVSITCLPASGTSFPLGETTVACSATDSATPARTATCSFTVTLVPPPPVLALTNFLAFGDSITKGEINDDTGGSCDPGPASTTARVRPQAVMPDLAYPAVVQRLLSARYTTQTFSMANEGKGTETAKDGTLRFPGVVAAHQPEVLLLLQGIIDIKDTGDPDAPIEALTTDIRIAKANGVQAIFLSTLLPVGTGFQGCGIENATVRATNDLIRALAMREDVHLVDTYAAFVGRVDTLIGSDGLHPTAAGQQVIAETFFDAIKTSLETDSESPPAGGLKPAPTLPRIAPRRPIVR